MRDESSRSSGFGELLRRHRLTAGLSQEALAQRARMSTEGISALERGYRRTPQRETVALLAGALALDETQREEFQSVAHSTSPRRPNGTPITVGPWSKPPIGNLPLPLSEFIGREREVGELSALVRSQRLVTLTGPGGVGKTQTALHVARVLSANVDGNASFIALASLRDPLLVPAAIASALGVQEMSNRPLVERLIAHLKSKTLLLVLDNCEHVAAAAASVIELLVAGCPHVRILTTSREPLAAAGERRYRLPPMSPDDALALFVDRAEAVDFHFTLSSENAQYVTEICRRLDHIPLAIELAAARVNLLSLPNLAEKLDDRFRILTAGRRTALPRQQTMRATIDWSYELLSDREQRVFGRLSVFAGGCTLDAAMNVCSGNDVAQGDVVELLASLAEKSLVTAESSRFGLLESMAQYAREKLIERGEYEQTALAHATYYLELIESFNAMREHAPKRAHSALSQPEHDNWRIAVTWALREGHQVPLGQRLVGVLGSGWVPLLAAEREGWVQAAHAAADDTTPAEICVHLDLAEAYVEWFQSRFKASLAAAERALAKCHELDDSLVAARARLVAGNALTVLGRPLESEAMLQAALACFCEHGATRSISDALRLLAILRHRSGALSEARALYTESAQTLEGIEGESGGPAHLTMLAELEFQAGDTNEALRIGLEAVAMYRALDDRFFTLQSLCNVAAYAISLQRYDEARTYAREALMLAAEDEISVPAALALQHLAATIVLPSTTPAERSRDALERAARVLGFVNARLETFDFVREYTERGEYDRIEGLLRTEFGNGELERLMTQGGSWTQDRAIAEARSI
jgi:predicted ATPase/transcriptional regulator with XRE-family HTH domain